MKVEFRCSHSWRSNAHDPDKIVFNFFPALYFCRRFYPYKWDYSIEIAFLFWGMGTALKKSK